MVFEKVLILSMDNFFIALMVIFIILYWVREHSLHEREAAVTELRKAIDNDLGIVTNMLLENGRVLEAIKLENGKKEVHAYNEKQAKQNWILERRRNFLAMDYDEFLDWLDLGELIYIAEAIEYFERADLGNHAQIMRIFLKRKSKS